MMIDMPLLLRRLRRFVLELLYCDMHMDLYPLEEEDGRGRSTQRSWKTTQKVRM
jgi:hypothetical protein